MVGIHPQNMEIESSMLLMKDLQIFAVIYFEENLLEKNIKRAKLKEIGKAGTISTPEKAMAAFPTTGNLKVTGPPALITEMVFPACASVFVLPNENSQQKNLQPMSSCWWFMLLVVNNLPEIRTVLIRFHELLTETEKRQKNTVLGLVQTNTLEKLQGS